MSLAEFARRRIAQPRAIVFPEGDDPIVQDAAVQLAAGGAVRPVLLCPPASFAQRLSAAGADPRGCVVADPTAHPRFVEYVEAYAAQHDLPEAAARLLVGRPLFLAAMMVAQGEAHGMVAGIAAPTEDVVVASQLGVGLVEHEALLSTFYPLEIPSGGGGAAQVLALTDPAMNPVPTAAELAGIATATAHAVRAMLDWQPRVALLSFSTKGSADHPVVEIVREAVELLRAADADFAFDGELQADAALDPRVAARKLGASPVAGRANVLVFPTLDAANIAAKLVLHFTDATAYGPFLNGLAAPVSDLSRGAGVADVVGTALLVAAVPRAGAVP